MTDRSKTLVSTGDAAFSSLNLVNRRAVLTALAAGGGLVALQMPLGVVDSPAAANPVAANPVAGRAAAGGLGPITVVSRSADMLDAFAVGDDGRVYTAAWEPGDTAFRGWWRIGTLEVAPCSPIGAVSRSANKLDVVVAGLNGRVYAAAWEPGDAALRGWWQVGALQTVPGAAVSIVSRSRDKLDVFATDAEGWVHTAAWQPADSGFRGWWPVAGGRTRPGAQVGAVSRSQDKLDVFITDLDGRILTAAWRPGDNGFRGWWRVGKLRVPRGAPVTAVSRSVDKLDVFVTGHDGHVRTAAWQPRYNGFRPWQPVGTLQMPPGAPVSAVCRVPDHMDVFATDADGWVRTAAWQPGDTAFRGWWPIAGGRSLPGAPVGAVSRSLDKLDALVFGVDARAHAAAWQPGDSAFRGWWLMGTLVGGLADPRVGDWKNKGISYKSENTAYSREAQGITTDGTVWYMVSNGRKSLRRMDLRGNLLAEVGPPVNEPDTHVGAPGYHDGWVYVPVQKPYGVWKVTADLSRSEWHPVATTDDRLSWCAVNPLNGRLYTTMYDIYRGQKAILFAYDRDTLQRQPEDDITLGPSPIHLDRIQGGTFTARGRVLLARCKPNGIFCFSTRTGACQGAKHLGNYGSVGSEVESVAVWPFRSTKGATAAVHILELDNDKLSVSDDCYLRSYSAPVPL